MIKKKATSLFYFGLSIFAFFSPTSSVAQQYGRRSTFSAGIDAALGVTSKSSPFGYGLSLSTVANVRLSDQLSMLGSVGYSGLFTKDTSPVADYHFIPLKAGVKIFPITDQQFYFSCSVGAGFGLIKGSKPSFIFGGGLGYEWLNGYELMLKYEGYQQRQSSTTYQPLNGQFSVAFGYYF